MGFITTGKHVKKRRFDVALALGLAVILAAVLLTQMQTPARAVGQTFTYTGGPQIYVVPESVTSLSVALNGAQGGSPASGGTGGLGARTSATLAVNPGEVLMIMVGGNGSTNGGWNGGGRGAGTGGGATDIRRQSGAFNTSSSCAYTLSCALNDRIVVAGGGGGGGWAQNVPGNANGGDGGQTGTSGTSANIGVGDATAGGGASPSTGGSAGTGSFTSSGQGAAAGYSGFGAASAWVAQATGGGGGGGYFGGGSGGVSQDPSTPQADGVGGGGGGSSWAGGSGVSAATFTTGANTGDGSVTIDIASAIPMAAFAFTGAPQAYTVPANTSQVYVRLYGGGAGATGDIVYGRLPVTAGQTLQVNIGERGYGDVAYFAGKTEAQGGWNGGGDGFFGPGWGGGTGGAGASDIRFCATAPCSLGDRLVVAGGGGGASYGAWGLGGGLGGGQSNGGGNNGNGGDFGNGGTLTAGGTTNGTGTATAGTLGQGGQSGQPFYGGGGGGGGLYGGGGGNGSGGGGGSSCASVSGPCSTVTNVLGSSNAAFAHSQGSGGSSSNGMAVITAMPEAVTGSVTNITASTATISATVNAKFLASTPKLFIGTNQATIESCSAINAPCTPSTTVLRTANLATVLAGDATQSVSGAITGLSANTTYYSRVCAQSVAGYSCGATTTFSTQLSISNNSLGATVGQAFSVNLIGNGGSGVYSAWALANNSTLPAGLTLNTATGVISGIPSSAATGTFDVQVTDSLNATVVKTISFVVGAAAQSSQPQSQAPSITQLSPRTVSTAGGSSVTITGSNLQNATVTVGGISVTPTSNNSTSLTFVVPAGLTGQVPVVLSTSLGILTFSNAITAIELPAIEPNSITRTLVFDFFAPGSSQITVAHKSKLAALESSEFKSVVCQGFTMGPTVLATDRRLALARANAVCAAIKKAHPNLITLRTTGTTETGVGGKVRRVEVTLRTN
jgi:hypothetical protein